MEFTEKFDTISSILSDIYNVHTNKNDYDGFIVKKDVRKQLHKKRDFK